MTDCLERRSLQSSGPPGLTTMPNYPGAAPKPIGNFAYHTPELEAQLELSKSLGPCPANQGGLHDLRLYHRTSRLLLWWILWPIMICIDRDGRGRVVTCKNCLREFEEVQWPGPY